MPNFDKTGPQEKGPLTGRGLGPCGGGTGPRQRAGLGRRAGGACQRQTGLEDEKNQVNDEK